MPHQKTLLFDLGGVIVRWVGIDALMEMKGMTRSAVSVSLSENPIFTAYECGHCNDDIFITEFIKHWDLGIDPLAGKQLWQSWVEDTYDGTLAALSLLRENYRTACLSNTNALHWERLKDHINVEACFDHAYASHILGAAKPDSKCYELALADMSVDAKNVIFFDDTQANIDAAQAMGIEGHLVDRHVGVVPLLKTLNLT